MSRRLFDHDPMTGITEWYHDTPGGFTLTYEQDCEPIVELNKQKQSMGRAYYARDDEMWRVASIPIVVQYKWLIDHGVDIMEREHWPKVRQLLNSNEYRYLKTAEVIV